MVLDYLCIDHPLIIAAMVVDIVFGMVVDNGCVVFEHEHGGDLVAHEHGGD